MMTQQHTNGQAPLDLAQFEGFTPGPLALIRADEGSREDWIIAGPGSTDGTFFEPIAEFRGSYVDALLWLKASDLLSECQRQRAEIERLQASEARLRAALTQVMSWIDNWSPTFTEDDEWAADEQAARAALSGQEGE